MTRLIDADGLKNTFWHGDLVPNKEMYHISEIKYAIDNAPTVTDVIPNEEGYEMYSKGYTLGKEKGKNERPQADNFDVEDFKKFVESRLDMQDLYLPIHFFYLLDEYRDTKAKEADNEHIQ